MELRAETLTASNATGVRPVVLPRAPYSLHDRSPLWPTRALDECIMGQAGSQGYTHHASVDDPQHAGTYFQCGLDAPAHRRVPSIVTWGARMNPWISRNSLSSRIAAASLVGLVILAPTSGASDQNLGIVSFANSGSPAVQADFLTGL